MEWPREDQLEVEQGLDVGLSSRVAGFSCGCCDVAASAGVWLVRPALNLRIGMVKAPTYYLPTF